MAKLKDSEPLSDAEVYGKPTPRTYLEALSDEQRKVLKEAGQLPVDDQDAAAGASEANQPGVVIPDPS